MSGHVLIIDAAGARRVLLRASLQAARFGTTAAPDLDGALAVAAARPPDIVLLDLREGSGVHALAILRARLGRAVPLVALTPADRAAVRLAALAAGADAALDHGTAAPLLQARIRSLLRARDEAAEMGLRDEPAVAPPGLVPSLATGLAEAQAAFGAAPAAIVRPARRARVAVAGAEPVTAVPPDLAALPGCDVFPLPARLVEGPGPDLVVIDGGMGDGSGTSGGAPAALRLLADLRSRSNTRHAATLLLLPPGAVETAAMALDLGAGDVATGPLAPEELAARVEALLQRKAQADRRRERVRLGLQAADRDALTGLHNRRYAEPMLERMAARARHDGRDLAVMMLDIDHFKRINDTWGHAAGDRILQAVARRLRDASRPGDLLARVGGEEFLIAMPDTTADAARTAAERLRHAVAGRPFALGPAEAREGREAMSRPAGQAAWATSATGEARLPETRPSEPGCAEVRVTVSIGVAVGAGTLPGTRLGGSLACPDLFERADGALYAAKTAGRNMVAMARSAA